MSDQPDGADKLLADERAALAAAAMKARLSRPGVSDPDEILRMLGGAITSASRLFDRLRAQGSAPFLPFAEFIRTFLRACAQFLEYAQVVERLPDLASDRQLDAAQSQEVRARFVEVMREAHALLAPNLGGTHGPAVRLEIDAIVLTATFHWLTREGPEVRARVEPQLLEIARDLHRRTSEINPDDDPEELASWVRVSAARIVRAFRPTEGERLLADEPSPVRDLQSAWDVLLAQLPLAATLANRNELLARMERLTTSALEFDKAARDGWVALALDPVRAAAAALIDAGGADDAHAVLELYSSLAGYEPSGAHVVRLFAHGGHVYRLLATEGGSGGAVGSRIPIDTRPFTKLTEASADGVPAVAFEQRKPITRQLRPLFGDEGLPAEGLALDPIGIAAWVPWHTVPAPDGAPIGSREGVRWRHPLASRWEPGHLAGQHFGPDLVIDTSLPSSSRLASLWGRSPRLGAVRRYDSTKEGAERLLDLLDMSADAVYFGHAASDPMSALGAGLRGPGGIVIPLDEIESRSFARLERLVLVACESGRSSPFMLGQSPAHAFAAAGIHTVVATLWTIAELHGERYVNALVGEIERNGASLSDLWRRVAAKTTVERVPFFCISP